MARLVCRWGLLLLCLAVLAPALSPSADAGVTRVTDTPYDEYAVRISGDWLVYVTGTGSGVWFDNEEIYIHQLSSGIATRLTNDGVRQYQASISGDQVVWTDYRWVTVGWDYDVFGYDISSDLLGPVSAVGAAQYQPSISGDRVVWVDNHDDISHYILYTEDPVSHIQGPVYSTPGGQWVPELDGERVVWEDQSSDEGDIYLYDFGTATLTPICIATGRQMTPDIDGDIVVWTDYRSGTFTIWFYNLSTSETGPVYPQDAVQYDPRVSGTKVVWHASGGVYLYDLATDEFKELSHGPGWEGHPDIDGDVIVWQGDGDGDWDIYRYVNLPPELAPIGDQIVSEGELLSFTVSATDPDDDPIILSASNLPAGAVFDPDTGEFSWTPGYGDAGTYPGVHFEVADDGELTDSEDITITARSTNRPPVLDSIGNKEVDEGELLTFVVGGSDPDDDPLAYTASNLPDGAAFDSDTRTFSWTPTFAQTGNYPGVRFEVSDGELSDFEEINISVGDVNRPPVLDPIGDKTVEVMATLSFALSCSDPEGDTLVCSASGLPAGASFDPVTEQFNWTPTSGQAGSYPGVTFEVSDGLLSDTEQIMITVTPTGVAVVIDIKPGSERNPVNPKSEGVLPVAVFSSDTFDATDIDPSTVYLAGASVAQNPDDQRWMIEEKDENGDGLMDVRLHFDTEGIDPSQFVGDYAVLTGSTYGGIAFQGSDFVTIVPKDLANDYWALEEIAECLDAGVALGYPDGLYRPNVAVARDQMAVFVSRAMAGGDDAIPAGPEQPTFSDVPESQWAYDPIEYAVANGVVAGYGDGSYQPGWVVTRGQMAVFIARAKGWVSIGDDMTTAPQLFTDVPAGYWSGTAVQSCVFNGVVQGYPDGYYRPTVQVTRDQMAVYIARAWDLSI